MNISSRLRITYFVTIICLLYFSFISIYSLIFKARTKCIISKGSFCQGFSWTRFTWLQIRQWYGHHSLCDKRCKHISPFCIGTDARVLSNRDWQHKQSVFAESKPGRKFVINRWCLSVGGFTTRRSRLGKGNCSTSLLPAMQLLCANVVLDVWALLPDLAGN